MDAEPSADKAASSKRRSRSRSTLSRRSTEDSSNADSNGSSVEKEVPSKDTELHNGAVGETEDAIRENAPKTATEVSSVNVKGEERHGEKVPRVGDKWKLHLDLSDSCSLSENDASDVDGISAPSASNPADEGQVEEPETKPSVLKDDDKRVAESVADDTSVLSDTSEFCGFEDSSSDQDYIEALIAIIQKCETTDDDCCLSSDEIPSSPKTEPEYDPARTYSHDDDSNSSSVFGHYDSGKDVLSPPASHLNVPSSKGKQKVKYSGSPVPSTSRSGTSKKLSIDLSNPAFRKPLDMGWKREIVFRSAGGSSTKGLADVYYFTPSGKKVRSNREMMENLEGTDLTLDNFTFTKEPLGINDPDKEVIRDARRTSVTPKDTGSPSTPTASSVKRIQKLKASAGEMSPVSDQSSASGPSNIKQEPMSVEEETDGLSESSSSGSVNRDQGATPADTSGAVEQKIPPAIAGPSGLNKHAGRSQSHLKLARSFPRIKVTSPRSGRGRGQTSPRGGGVNRGVTSQAGGSGGNMEIGMLPPMWKDKDGASTTKVLSSPGAAPALQSTPSRGPGRLPRGGKGGGQVAVPPKDAAAESRKRKAAASPPEEAAGVSKKPRTVDAANGDAEPLQAFMSRYMANVCETYNAMLHIFEYLKVQEVLRAARVCRLWCSVATHDSLWQTVRLKNSPVADWKGCVATLAKRGTRHLDMRKMLVPAGRADEWWAAFCANIGRVPCLESVELCRCPAAVVERVAQQCPQLTTLSALSIKDQSINLSSIGQLKNLQELRIRNLSGMYLNGNLDGLKELTNLKHLSLTMVKNLGHAGCGVLGSLQTLETLELGECCDLPESFGNQTLSQLHSLQRLRLEKGQGDGCPTFALLASVRTLPSLVTLELVNFDVKPGFDTALARCQNVRRLLIIPTYISQSATTNHMVLGGVTKLGDSLTHFVWGVTHELLRVTELFVDQCEDQKGPPGSHTGKDKEKKKSYTPPLPGAGAGDSIPVLRPVPGSIPPDDGGNKSTDSRTRGEGSSPTSDSSSAVPTPGAPQVDILPLTKLQKMLTTALPNTKIKILKVAFQATWRQYISETDF
ncbi:uncharacterized protein LOC126210592 isoform X2 [Schistocerca nitens]|uniref:uncharacterized protein LOC126210592 isoform X2 n=1 Tax=Schistocerca nitens TaxID=7011 RepID=UPI0021189C34|nr:uncharacterized protein LOC126210592 isoform X2 [Schistocerca nitens]